MMRFVFFLILGFLLTISSTQGQELINGMVVDSATFAPLPYVNIILKNKNKGTISDTHGNFKLVVSPDDTLSFSFIGYKTLEVISAGWQPSVILMSENPTVLKTVTIEGARVNPYDGMFDEENALFNEKLGRTRFYQTKSKKQKIKMGNLAAENVRARTYVDVVIQNEDTKKQLMNTYQLSETEYYDILSKFNARNYTVMYYLTAGELVSMLNSFFRQHAKKE
jgi:hypothetical protein